MIFEELIDHLDAAVFSGDCLYDESCRKLLKEHLVRWDRELSAVEKVEINKEDIEKAIVIPKDYPKTVTFDKGEPFRSEVNNDE